ncbi:MAG: hypothetical protein L3J71_06515 [Victivallaceae bacterium]|nr:hypothetical protein [Victivallaceae bacterium]
MNISTKKLFINSVKKACLCLTTLMIASLASATNYYVDNAAGSSNNNGSETAPWDSLQTVCQKSSQFNAGDVIHFKRGQRFYNFYNGNLASSGNATSPITFQSYGDANDPAPILSVGKRIDQDNSWTNLGDGRYLYTGYAGSVVNFIWEDGFPVKKASSSALTDGYWYLVSGTGIYIRPTDGQDYSTHEYYLANNGIVFNVANRSNLIFKDLKFEYSKWGIYNTISATSASSGIKIENCEFSRMYAGIWLNSPTTSIENHDIEVIANIFSDIRFAFICTGLNSTPRHYNLTIADNVIKNIAINGAYVLSDTMPDVEALSFQNLHDSTIINNTIINGIKTSDGITDADGDPVSSSGIIIWIAENATMENVKIKNNYIEDVEKGIVMGAGTAYKLSNNLLKGNIIINSQTGMRLNSSDVNDSTLVKYNEFYDNDISIVLYSGARGYQFSDNRSFWPKLFHIQTWQAWQLTDSWFNYNVYQPDGALWRNEANNTTYANLASWQQTNQDPDSVTTWNGSELVVKDGLEIWLKSDAGLFDETGQPVTPGGTIQTWQDQSGNERDYSCTSSTRRPQLTTGISPNGAAGIYFDGVNDAMKLDNASMSLKSVFIVFKASNAITASSPAQTISNQAGEFSFGSCTGLLTDELFTVMSQNSSDINCRSGYTSASNNISGFNIMSVVYNSTNSAYDIYLNGTIVSNVKVGSDDNGLVANNLTFHIGARDLAGGYFNGYIFEYIAYNKAFNLDQKQAVEDYLTKKYSTSNTLPVTNNLEIWLKADAGLLDDSGQPVATSGAVQTWQDQSGNNRDYYCTSSARRPVLEDRISPNGAAGIYFDGIDDAMKLDNVTLTTKSVFIVFKSTSPFTQTSPAQTISNQAGEFSFGSCTGLLTDELFTVMSKNSSNSNCRSGYTSATENISWFNILSVVYNSTDSVYDIYLNGIKVDNATSGIDDNALSAQNITFHLGARDLAGGYFDGYIFEYILYNDSLNATNRVAVENYLTNKYQ